MRGLFFPKENLYNSERWGCQNAIFCDDYMKGSFGKMISDAGCAKCVWVCIYSEGLFRNRNDPVNLDKQRTSSVHRVAIRIHKLFWELFADAPWCTCRDFFLCPCEIEWQGDERFRIGQRAFGGVDVRWSEWRIMILLETAGTQWRRWNSCDVCTADGPGCLIIFFPFFICVLAFLYSTLGW